MLVFLGQGGSPVYQDLQGGKEHQEKMETLDHLDTRGREESVDRLVRME